MFIRLLAIKDRTHIYWQNQRAFWTSEQRLTAFKGRTRQLPKPNNTEYPETILQASPQKYQYRSQTREIFIKSNSENS